MRRLLPLVLLAGLVAGCVKPVPVITAATAEPVAYAAVRTELGTADLVDAPDRLQDALHAALVERNLQPLRVEASSITGRSTGVRLESLGADGLRVLLEAEVTYFAQVAGRYRWTVDVTLTLADGADAPLTRQEQIPVFLQFSHEKEDAALADATPSIERLVGEVLDDHLSR